MWARKSGKSSWLKSAPALVPTGPVQDAIPALRSRQKGVMQTSGQTMVDSVAMGVPGERICMCLYLILCKPWACTSFQYVQNRFLISVSVFE